MNHRRSVDPAASWGVFAALNVSAVFERQPVNRDSPIDRRVRRQGDNQSPYVGTGIRRTALLTSVLPDRSKAPAYAALAAVCFFWGTTYLGIRIAIESMPPAVLVCVRYFLSGYILLLAARFSGAHLPRGRELLANAISGVLVLGIGNGALAYAELIIPSGLASLFITISPFWYVIFEALLPGGVPLHAPTILGMVVGFSGSALLFVPGILVSGLGSHTFLGFLILQVGSIAWCLGSIYQRRQPAKAHPVVTGAVQQLASSFASLPVALLTAPRHLTITSRSMWALCYLVVFGSIVGYSAFAYSIARLPVALVSIYPYVNSVVAVALGWMFFREPFGPRELLAMTIIFGGVAIVKWQTSKAEQQRALAEPARISSDSRL